MDIINLTSYLHTNNYTLIGNYQFILLDRDSYTNYTILFAGHIKLQQAPRMTPQPTVSQPLSCRSDPTAFDEYCHCSGNSNIVHNCSWDHFVLSRWRLIYSILVFQEDILYERLENVQKRYSRFYSHKS